MDTSKNQDEFYKKLKVQLTESTNWPSEYLYKFIVITEKSKIVQIEAIFDNTGAVISTKESKNGKYTSVSINVVMSNPDAVISKYLEVTSNVEGVISL
jgi:putative lipoic acid-binding regulatory protein